MSLKIKTTLIAALSQYRGDNVERARAAFRNCTQEQMDQVYGFSGQTRRQILAEYEEHAREVDEANTWVRQQLPAGEPT